MSKLWSSRNPVPNGRGPSELSPRKIEAKTLFRHDRPTEPLTSSECDENLNNPSGIQRRFVTIGAVMLGSADVSSANGPQGADETSALPGCLLHF